MEVFINGIRYVSMLEIENGQKCPQCENATSYVTDSRPHQSNQRMRRRKCYRCGHTWKTIEVLFVD